MPKNFFRASAVLIGYIIGVGMFGVPYLVTRSGLLVFFILIVVISLAQHFIHLCYANVILATREYHRLPGYAGVYLGENGKKIVTVAKLIGSYGALLAYIIITGIFLNELLSPWLGGNEFIYATALFIFQAAVVYFGIGMLARAELVMSAILLIVIVMIAAKGWGLIDHINYPLVDWKYALLPYGAILFAVDGNGAVPIIVRLLRRNRRAIRNVIRVGLVIPVAVIITFTLIVVGITGGATTPDALTGLRGEFGNGLIFLALIFGVFTMITSFLGVSEATREMLNWDYQVDNKTAWALAVFVPYAFYLLGLKNLIEVISFAGAVAGGLCGMTLLVIFMRVSKKRGGLTIIRHRPKEIFIFLLILMFAGGIFYEIIHFMGLAKNYLF